MYPWDMSVGAAGTPHDVFYRFWGKADISQRYSSNKFLRCSRCQHDTPENFNPRPSSGFFPSYALAAVPVAD